MNIIKNLKSKNRKENTAADLASDLKVLQRARNKLDAKNRRFDFEGERKYGEKSGEIYCKYFL